MTNKKQPPPPYGAGRQPPQPRTTTVRRKSSQHPNALVLRLDDERPRENRSAEEDYWAVEASAAKPPIMSREEVAQAFRDLRAGSALFAAKWGKRLFATLGAFRAKAERLEREAASEAGEYEKIGAEIGRLVEQKQAAYGDAFGKSGEVLWILYPNGIPPEKLDDAAAVARVLDKLFRIATDQDALGESPWRDIAGYALLGAARAERRR